METKPTRVWNWFDSDGKSGQYPMSKEDSLKVDERLGKATTYLDIAKREGRKDDTGKLPYELLAPELLESVSQVLAFGARKYAPRNWELGMSWGRVFGACMRHMWSWWRGDGKDMETGFSHLHHAGACLMFLIAYEERNIGTDDRPEVKA